VLWVVLLEEEETVFPVLKVVVDGDHSVLKNLDLQLCIEHPSMQMSFETPCMISSAVVGSRD
jgi:hypothetical protein